MDKDAETLSTTTWQDPPDHLASSPVASLIKELTILAIVHGLGPMLGHSESSMHHHSSISSATQT